MISKRCHEQYHIERAESLYLGGLYKYHSQELGDIADGDEGRFRYVINFLHPTRVSAEWVRSVMFLDNRSFQNFAPGRSYFVGSSIRTILDPSGVGGIVSLDVGRVGFDGLAEGIIEVSGFAIQHFLSPNYPIFCMTSHSEPVPPQISTYGAYWTIDDASAGLFAKLLQRWVAEIIHTLPLRHEYLGYASIVEDKISFDEGRVSFPISSLRCRVERSRVIYAAKQFNIRWEGDLPRSRLLRELSGAHFRKPVRYSAEEEYRFCVKIYVSRDITERQSLFLSLAADALSIPLDEKKRSELWALCLRKP